MCCHWGHTRYRACQGAFCHRLSSCRHVRQRRLPGWSRMIELAPHSDSRLGRDWHLLLLANGLKNKDRWWILGWPASNDCYLWAATWRRGTMNAYPHEDKASTATIGACEVDGGLVVADIKTLNGGCSIGHAHGCGQDTGDCKKGLHIR